MKHKVKFTFPTDLVQKPVIYLLGKDFNIVTNIRRADVTDDRGWVVLELEGEENSIDTGLEWVKSQGVRVDPVSGDIVEG
ncbi:NIL domain-containing protein [Dehalococcoidia bacterium]|nr:NIL domain-containing protein [Dehalococcoidia bacterium]